MKISSKLSIGLLVSTLLLIVFCLKTAGDYNKASSIPAASDYEVSHAGRVPAFSVVIIKGRAFSARKPEVKETEQAANHTSALLHRQKPGLFPLAYQLISRGLISGK